MHDCHVKLYSLYTAQLHWHEIFLRGRSGILTDLDVSHTLQGGTAHQLYN